MRNFQVNTKNLGLIEAAEYIGVSRSRFYKCLADGSAPAGFTIGRKRLFPIVELDAWLERLAQEVNHV